MPKYSEKMRELVTEAMRNDIYLASVELINTEGGKAFTTERLAQKLGMSRSLIYNYFKNKDELIGCIVGESFFDLCKKMRIAAESRTPLRERIFAVAKLMTEDFAQQRELYILAINSIAPPGDENHPIARGNAEKEKIIASLIEEGIKIGIFAPVNIGAALALFTGAFFEIYIKSLISSEKKEKKSVPDVREVVNIFLKGVSK